MTKAHDACLVIHRILSVKECVCVCLLASVLVCVGSSLASAQVTAPAPSVRERVAPPAKKSPQRPVPKKKKKTLTTEQMYFRALVHFRMKKWKKAEEMFLRTYEMLSALKTKKGKNPYILVLGRCDTLSLAARAAWRAGEKFRACHRMDTFHALFSTVPPTWKEWSINPVLPRRIRKAKVLRKRCWQVPSKVTVTKIPEGAKLERGVMRKGEVFWRPSASTFLTKAVPTHLRIKQKGRLVWQRLIYVNDWEHRKVVVRLSDGLPKKRNVPPAVAPWVVGVGIGAGLVVVGGVAGLVVWSTTRPVSDVSPTIEFRGYTAP
ncbi:MAG TPA: hypothetical protein DCE42_04350 [Myxococcales bacterium]|nr:hypothetical protein [Deltaproteobacteria bacterium]MBU54899.1 hypothetical protein [Deltaproteobacteria bacterium]HAA53958.1 hypothetical protein [Myxococcales bacterium]